jgi:hypothetical protein
MTRYDLDELVSTLGDAELSHLAVSSMKGVKRRLARTRSRHARSGPVHGRNPLERAIQEIIAELTEFGGSDETWWED